MKRILTTLTAILLLLAANRLAQAESYDFDSSSGYGYMPDGYNRLASAQTQFPPFGPGPSAVPGPAPMPEYAPAEIEGEFFGDGSIGGGWQLIGEYLYLRPSNAEVAFAHVVDEQGTVPLGRTGVLNPHYDSGFRLSAARALGDCTAIGVSYTYFDTTVNGTLLDTDNPDPTTLLTAVRSLVIHPNSPDAGDLGAMAEARQTIRFQLADIDYKAALVNGPHYCANVLVGARFASLRQSFDSELIVAADDVSLVQSRVRFDGGGIRLGLEGERQSPANGFLVYGKGAASFVAGTFRADYVQANTDTTTVVAADGRTNRVITMLDFELGAGWASPDGALRVTGGWMVSAWYNTITVADHIRAVQNNDPGLVSSPLDNVLVFDGLVFRVEGRF